jgi:hypothetical protein
VKREKTQKQKTVEPQLSPEEVRCGNCLFCNQPIMANNVNQGYVHVDCITKMEATYKDAQ